MTLAGIWMKLFGRRGGGKAHNIDMSSAEWTRDPEATSGVEKVLETPVPVSVPVEFVRRPGKKARKAAMAMAGAEAPKVIAEAPKVIAEAETAVVAAPEVDGLVFQGIDYVRDAVAAAVHRVGGFFGGVGRRVRGFFKHTAEVVGDFLAPAIPPVRRTMMVCGAAMIIGVVAVGCGVFPWVGLPLLGAAVIGTVLWASAREENETLQQLERPLTTIGKGSLWIAAGFFTLLDPVAFIVILALEVLGEMSKELSTEARVEAVLAEAEALDASLGGAVVA